MLTTWGRGKVTKERKARKKGNPQLRPPLIEPRNQQRDAKRPTHNTLLAISALAKPQRQVTDGLRAALDPQRLVVVERVVLALDARVLHHAPRVRLQARHGASDVSVDLDDFFDGRGFEEGRGYALFDAQDDAVVCGDLLGC